MFLRACLVMSCLRLTSRVASCFVLYYIVCSVVFGVILSNLVLFRFVASYLVY